MQMLGDWQKKYKWRDRGNRDLLPWKSVYVSMCVCLYSYFNFKIWVNYFEL